MMDKLIVYGTRWCGDTFKARKILDKADVDYKYIDINQDTEGARFVKEINHGNRSVPTIVFPDKNILVEPSKDELIGKLKRLNLLRDNTHT